MQISRIRRVWWYLVSTPAHIIMHALSMDSTRRLLAAGHSIFNALLMFDSVFPFTALCLEILAKRPHGRYYVLSTVWSTSRMNWYPNWRCTGTKPPWYCQNSGSALVLPGISRSARTLTHSPAISWETNIMPLLNYIPDRQPTAYSTLDLLCCSTLLSDRSRRRHRATGR